ncbi:hypothetical protein GCM10022631_29300 [Deinococcus rubellus]|uniref:Uncharacterized protein n=1 Tax=Deinococcus rubellus TaxID=1889240 RepID=A0ABY5YGL9_9DEIO|nr:hypothetical protein [Deinococcus rubellus]UWX63429.1 hypothetical protein N0D28_11820 [Deinococcus rubellus]
MDDKTSSDRSKPTPDQHHPHGGDKDTNDLHDIKGVQQTGMEEKAKQVADLPDSVKGSAKNIWPQKR